MAIGKPAERMRLILEPGGRTGWLGSKWFMQSGGGGHQA